MRNIVRTLGTVTLGAAFALTVPSGVHAAPGEFAYRSQLGGPSVLNDIESGRCYNTPGAAGVVANDTDMDVATFPGPNCEGVPMDADTEAFESVVFDR